MEETDLGCGILSTGLAGGCAGARFIGEETESLAVTKQIAPQLAAGRRLGQDLNPGVSLQPGPLTSSHCFR